jgi:chemotaxis protein MotB
MMKQKTIQTLKLFGGAWKVAYGDFITALMALFLVLWVLSMQVEQTFATTDYFQSAYLLGFTPSDPVIQPETRPGSIVNQIIGYEESVLPNEEESRDTIQYKVLEQMAMQYYKLLNLEEYDPSERVKIKIEQDSLRITLFDNDNHPVFTGQNAEFTEWGLTVLRNMSWLLTRESVTVNNQQEKIPPMRVRIDAHTFRNPDKDNEFQATNDQAGTTREKLVWYGLPESQVEHLTSWGASTPENVKDPENRRNQRLEISIVFDKDTELRTDLID